MLFYIFLSVFIIGGTDAFTKLCHSCTHVTDVSHCTSMVKCFGEESCRTKVEFLHGQFVMSKGCARAHDSCHDITAAVIGVGKKRDGHEHGTVVCQRCCDRNGCNSHGCEQFFMTTTQQTTTAFPTCRDHEDDGFLCSDYDQFGFCTDTAAASHKLALERCPKYCGFCDADGNYKATTEMPTTTTPSPMTASDHFTSTPAPTAAPTTVTTDQAVTFTDMTTTAAQVSDCVDKEDASFSCQQWASYGFCVDNTGTGHDIAVERCSKYCGFCA